MKTAFSRRQFLDVGARALGAAALGNCLTTPVRAQSAPQITRVDLGYAWMLQGGGSNAFVIPGMNEDGAFVVDGGLAVFADALLDAVREVTGQERIHTLVNTHYHPEQTGLNERVGAGGGIIIAHEHTAWCLQNSLLSATYEGRYGPLADAGIPNRRISGSGTMKFAGQEIIYSYLPAAHTNGDIFLYFPILDTLIAGGPVTSGQWPVIDWRQGGWIGGLVRAYEELVDVVSADTVVIPAHGPALKGTDVVRMRNMYSELHITLAEQLNIGMGWDDIVHMNPLKPFEDRFGAAAAFLESAHRSMQLAYVPD